MTDQTRAGTRGHDGERLRAGVVGAGSMGRHHARVYAELPGVDLVGVHDVDRAAAEATAEAHGGRAVGRADLLAAADLVSVAVPTAVHADVARACVEAGVHLLVEKPFVADPETGLALAREARAAGLCLQVGHVERFNPAVEKLREVLAGVDPVAFEARRLGPPAEDRALDGVVRDLMLHDLDLLRSLFGEAATVRAASAAAGPFVAATLGFEGGVIGSVTASRTTARKLRRLEITAADCFVVVDYIDQSIRVHRRSLPEYVERRGEIRYRHEAVVERPLVRQAEPLRRELEAFVEAVRAGEEPRVTAADGGAAVELARRVEAAADRG